MSHGVKTKGTVEIDGEIKHVEFRIPIKVIVALIGLMGIVLGQPWFAEFLGPRADIHITAPQLEDSVDDALRPLYDTMLQHQMRPMHEGALRGFENLRSNNKEDLDEIKLEQRELGAQLNNVETKVDQVIGRLEGTN